MSNKTKKRDQVKVFSKKKAVDQTDKIIDKLSNFEIDASKVKHFKDLPLSPPTLKGLKESDYETPTEIQRESLIHSLKGSDILGAAKTGSGKTLAFLIPVLETLFKQKWTRYDGVGAVIITPTRELAYQIFETLRKVGFHHDFSAGLIIGGKDLHFEKHRMDKVNIVICTPGRLLQHMDENPLFDCVNMKILVLDEADRCLDLGFETTMNSIIENLPEERQTLLFSATQTKSVKDLARLSLKAPKYISVHENAQYSTPENLTQSYVVCELHDKMALLWSFIKNHNKHKILVFLSSCKQVKYTYEIFCKLRPNVNLLALYGSLHQERRMYTYNSFANKHHAVLFATDIAARGLDFPEVNWVVQLDCPEDANTYIHRVGRTARYQKGGEALLVLLPSEKEAMLENLKSKKIPINEIKVNPMKLTNPQIKMEAFLAKDPNLKASAQRAFQAYIKSVFLMKDKGVFNVASLNTDTYARSLGLVVSPRIRFLQKQNKSAFSKESGNNVVFAKSQNLQKSDSDNQSSFQNQTVPKGKEIYNFGGADSDSEDDLLMIKRRDHQLEGVPLSDDVLDNTDRTQKKKPITKAALAKKILKKNIVANKKFVFTESGDIEIDQAKMRTTEEGKNYEEAEESGINISEAKKVMRAEDKIDRKLFRDKIKMKHREKKIKEKKLRKKDKQEVDEDKAYSGSESDDSEPDLSWLPDPDKIYGEKFQNSSDEMSESNNGEDRSHELSSEEELPPQRNKQTNTSTKRKSQANSKSVKKLKKSKTDDVEIKDTGLSLEEDEELVLKFLSSKR